MSVTESLFTTPLHAHHVAAGARMMPFAGYDMPVQYAGVIAEHQAVRSSAGIFDVSHMGQVFVSGPTAADDLQHMLGNDITRLTDDGQAQYSLLTNAQGGIEDDLIVYRRAADEFLLIVNASRRAHDVALITAAAQSTTQVVDASDTWAMIALQGPVSLDVLADLGVDVRSTAAFRSIDVTPDSGPMIGIKLIVATTGYTGESGCEIMVDASHAPAVWDALAAAPRVTLCGLAARDTLRLEVCYPLHGNDIGPDTDAVGSGLSWTIGWQTDFTGSDALRTIKADGPTQRLIALKMLERGIPRPGCTLHLGDRTVGTVTSGTMSPSLGIGIALARVDSDAAAIDTDLQVDVRGRRYAARIAAKPLYSPKDSTR